MGKEEPSNIFTKNDADRVEKCQIFEIRDISQVDNMWGIINRLGIRRNRALNEFKKIANKSVGASNFHEVLDLKTGDVIEVRTKEEIIATLKGSKYKGLSFMPEMLKYCGKQFKVLKKVKKYILEGYESTCVRPKNTVILENVFCDGSWHGGCDRTCYCLWREKWLKRV